MQGETEDQDEAMQIDGRPALRDPEDCAPYLGLQRGRIAVQALMSTFLDAGQMWAEEAATGRLLEGAYPHVQFRKFTTSEEARNGADWLWWWIDHTGTSFGMLVQAKILKRRGGGWHIDFGYRRRATQPTQVHRLFVTAEKFGVPAVYILYCGDRIYRAGLDCGSSVHPDGHCRERERAGVTILTAVVTDWLLPLAGATAAAKAFHESTPLEDIADPDRPQSFLRPLGKVSPEVSQFMLRPQDGARQVAKDLLEPVHRIRRSQFSAALLDRVESTDDALFHDLPADRGHFGVPYIPHILGGLRRTAPGYVENIILGRTPPAWVTDSVEGIVVIRLPR
ncbi:hypothetical protein FDG2_4183 [Candidatus Protofrankia californiensis]|uniref:Uncharacterized protein n=1 Tax=Candidatus Protofrankia californiensis TaxID=1839754 RepID=A0A1C3P3U7_9ACTN|nr:hypothetical protein FDG2_4183 [Candidatus Protofrankia californiensis]